MGKKKGKKTPRKPPTTNIKIFKWVAFFVAIAIGLPFVWSWFQGVFKGGDVDFSDLIDRITGAVDRPDTSFFAFVLALMIGISVAGWAATKLNNPGVRIGDFRVGA